MDQNKRLILVILLTGVVLFGWSGIIRPLFFPAPQPKPAAQAPADGGEADGGGQLEGDGQEQPPEAAKVPGEKADWVAPKNPARPNIVLGSLDPKSGYFLKVTATSRGAAISSIALNDPRYKQLSDPQAPLYVVDTTSPLGAASLATGIAAFDDQLAAFDTDSTEVHWKVTKTIPDPQDANILQGVVFTLTSPDGHLQAVKTYRLSRVANSGSTQVRDTDPTGYVLDVSLSFRNLSEQAEEVAYELQGPVGLPLENRAHTSKYRELELGFLEKDGELSTGTITASDVTEQFRAAARSRQAREKAAAADRALRDIEQRLAKLEADEDAPEAELGELRQAVAEQRATAQRLTNVAREASTGLERWDTPYRYLGVEVQYFVSLLFSGDDRPIAARYQERRISRGVPVVVAEREESQFNDISFRLTSTPIALAPGAEVTHTWQLYAGPKRQELLEPLGAGEVLDLGWFSYVSRAMLWILENLHSLGLPYWLAIIGLTVLVRGAMFPISRKQAIGAAKMKELQPKLTALKEKYGKDQEKMLRAQMDLFRKHGYGPLGPMASGCLPIILQLPIFIGLYRSLQTSVDLRREPFLWIENLAAPDELFQMPFSIFYLGSDFNLLPLITVVLFYIQQKLFMPPATSPEQEMQYKMMNFMMLGMGFFFYHVPAGLCLYFIASSLWSIGERTLLTKTKAAHIGDEESAEIDHELEEFEESEKKRGGKRGKAKPNQANGKQPGGKKKSPGFMERLLEAAETARRDAEMSGDKNKPRSGTQNGGAGKKKSKSSRRS